jgi:hypothetical protein
MRDWRGVKATVGDGVFYVMADGIQEPRIHEAWVDEANEARILVRPTAGPAGAANGNGRGIRRLAKPEDFVVVKGQGFA